jgi:hypothetical protein
VALQDALKEVDMVDMHLEVDIIPVSNVDRSKDFYARLGWRLDEDVVQRSRQEYVDRPGGHDAASRPNLISIRR